MSAQTNTSSKIIPLESMRGLAAFMVFLFHFILGFMPQRHGQESATAIAGGNLMETPFFFLINGHAAVTFFFVLSGFVLSYSYFRKGNSAGLVGSIIKRWPRLFPIALISTLISWLLIKYGLYSYSETALITNSQWMARFAHASGDFLNSTLNDAFLQGFFFTFFRGDENLNTSLWTMHYEFIGSLVVFALIPILNGLRGRLAIIVFLILMMAAFYISVYMCAFVMGCFLSYYRCQISNYKSILPLNKFMLVISLLFVMVAFGYTEPGRGFYSFMQISDPGMMRSLRILIHCLAAVILIDVILNYQAVYAVFNSGIGRFLGRCSFALYVIHVPLIFSFSCYLFLSLINQIGYRLTVFVTFILTTLLLFLISWIMTLLDETWCRYINRNIKKLI